MRIYVDVCSFNRPFDDQSQLRIRLEAEAKLRIQEEIRSRKIELVWSYVLDYENAKNPYQERKVRISGWRDYAKIEVQESADLLATAGKLHEEGLPKIDSLHIACAIAAECEYFITTDDRILRCKNWVTAITIADPILFVKECEL
jgi:predicted nucleic acid-binding protein